MTALSSQFDRMLRRFLSNDAGRTFAVGAGNAFLVKTIGAVLLLIGQIVAARLLGAEEYGYFAYAQSVLLIITIFTILGYDLSLLRFVPEYSVGRNWGALKGVLTHSFRLAAGVSVGVVLLAAAVLWVFPHIFPKGQAAALYVMLLSVPLYTLTMLRQSTLRAFKHVVLADLPESIIRPLLFIVALPIAAQLTALDAAGAWWAYWVVVVIAFVVGTRMMLAKIPPQVGAAASESRRSEWANISLDMMWMNAMNVVFNQAAVVLLGFFGSTLDVALFSAVTRIAFFISFAMFAVSAIAAPMISEFYYGGKTDDLQRIMALSAAFLAVVTLAANLLLLLAGRQVLGLFGSRFREAYGLLLLLMLGHTFKSFAGPASYLLNMSGRQQFTRRMMLVFVIVHLLINLLLIPPYGGLGAAWATAVTMILWNLALAYASFRFVHVDPTFLSLLKYRRLLKFGG